VWRCVLIVICLPVVHKWQVMTCVLQVGEDGRVPMCELMYGWALQPKSEVEPVVTEPVAQPGIHNTHAVMIVIITRNSVNYCCTATWGCKSRQLFSPLITLQRPSATPVSKIRQCMIDLLRLNTFSRRDYQDGEGEGVH